MEIMENDYFGKIKIPTIEELNNYIDYVETNIEARECERELANFSEIEVCVLGNAELDLVLDIDKLFEEEEDFQDEMVGEVYDENMECFFENINYKVKEREKDDFDGFFEGKNLEKMISDDLDVDIDDLDDNVLF